MTDPKDRLIALRKEAGFTQKKLAEIAKITSRTLQMYESGDSPLSRASAETVLALAKTLGVSVEDLIG